jgi:HTH-type transcriptional regulator, glycine betaine synthesis regulator
MPQASTAKASTAPLGQRKANGSSHHPPSAAALPEALTDIQKGMAGIFADLADLLGNPSSLGSIYGLLFASPEPLSMDEIVERLDISTGTASQGLRRLVELDAVVPSKGDGERVTRYSAKLELRPFVSMFLNQQLLPRLGKSSDRLTDLERALEGLCPSDQETLRFRIGRAAKWHRRAGMLLPLIQKFLRG